MIEAPTMKNYPNRRTPLTLEQRQLVADNLRIVHWFLRQHPKYARYFGYDDAFQIGCLGLIRAAQTWDPARGAITTLAPMNINQELAHEMRRLCAKKRTPPGPFVYLDQIVDNDITIQDVIPSSDPTPEDAFEYRVLTDQAHDILEHDDLLRSYFGDEKNQSALAREMGVAQVTISNWIAKRLRSAREAMAANG